MLCSCRQLCLAFLYQPLGNICTHTKGVLDCFRLYQELGTLFITLGVVTQPLNCFRPEDGILTELLQSHGFCPSFHLCL
jgi:hypothetical protein